jgi:formate hydrogenlyase subunit 4
MSTEHSGKFIGFIYSTEHIKCVCLFSYLTAILKTKGAGDFFYSNLKYMLSRVQQNWIYNFWTNL